MSQLLGMIYTAGEFIANLGDELFFFKALRHKGLNEVEF